MNIFEKVKILTVMGGLLLFGFIVICRLIYLNVKEMEYLYMWLNKMEISKQDDTSEYITDEEWLELSKKYGFDWDVKPYDQMTYIKAVKLLEYLKDKRG